MTNKPERWRSIAGFENYQVSDSGRVRSKDHTVRSHSDNRQRRFRGRIIVPYIRNGYPSVALSQGGVVTKLYVHRLVLLAFWGQPLPGEEACHNNGDRTDNRLENLRWDRHGSNMDDAVAHGTHWAPNANKTHCNRGHPFDEVNTIIRPEGRGCRECRRLMERARYHRRKNST